LVSFWAKANDSNSAAGSECKALMEDPKKIMTFSHRAFLRHYGNHLIKDRIAEIFPVFMTCVGIWVKTVSLKALGFYFY